MPQVNVQATGLPLLLTIDGESKTAKTTATDAICTALRQDGLKVYEADAGAFFRRMTICALENLGYDDLDGDDPHVSPETLYVALSRIISSDAAFDEREWSSLQGTFVEQYVSVVGHAVEAQHAMEVWYDKIIEDATAHSSDIMVINARNPRERLHDWQSSILDMLVYCGAQEAARRILFARGVSAPSEEQLAKQTAEVQQRRELDRHRDKYPYLDAQNVIKFGDGTAPDAASAITQSWNPASVSNVPDALPATIMVDTTSISLEQTKATFAALARAAVAFSGGA